MPRIPLVLATSLLGSTLTSQAAIVSTGNLTVYQLTATYDDGGIMSGTFTIDSEAPNRSTILGRGQFEIQSWDLRITNTSRYVGSSSGVVHDLLLFQRPDLGEQWLLFESRADEGQSGAFGDFVFSPYSGPAGTASPIEGIFVRGILDGAGVSDAVSVDLRVVPEPTTASLIVLVAIARFLRRSRPRSSTHPTIPFTTFPATSVRRKSRPA